MDLDDFKKVWKASNEAVNQLRYTADEIQSFRKARSRDFTKWISNSLKMDFVIKALMGLGFLPLIVLFHGEVVIQLVCALLSLGCFSLILLERPYYRRSKQLDQTTENLQKTLQDRLAFLKSFYFRIQFLIALSNPLLVTLGSFYYYQQKYGTVHFDDLEDVLVFTAILVVAFLFTIPTMAGMYGFHFKSLQNTLSSLEDEGHWKKEMKRYHHSKTILTYLFGALLVIGILALVLILVT